MQSTKHYTELEGAGSKDFQVSTPVYDAKEFFNQYPPSVQVLGIRFALKEISQTGIVIRVPAGLSVSDVQEPQLMSLEQGGREIYACHVVISFGNSQDTQLRLVFAEKGVDIDEIARKNAAALAVTGGAVTAQKSDLTFSIPDEYKIFCTDVLDFLSDKRRFIQSSIAPYEEGFSGEEIVTIASDLEDSSRSAWQELWFRGNDLVLPYLHDNAAKTQLKQFTEKLVTHELVGGKNWHRSYFKPMGYPGDFQIMNYMYDHNAEGSTTYARYLHSLGLISGKPIVSRMEAVSNSLENVRSIAPDSKMYHVMSIGSGPAREVQRFLRNTEDDGVGYSFTLVDQEKQALDYAISAAYKELAPSESNVIVSGMHTSFTEMLRPMSTFRHMPQQHLIYSAGLVDYLNPGLSRKLVTKLYDYLAPGGTLLIGNVNDAQIGTYWPMEFVLDWTLYFRNGQEMYDMAGDCKGAEINVETDATGAVFLLNVTRPA
jgi:hypothetical protein